MSVFLLAFCLLVISNPVSFAAEPVLLSLSEAIQRTLAHNPDIQIEKENVRIREATELSERAQFDSTLHGQASLKRFVSSTTSLLETPITSQMDRRDTEGTFGVETPFPWGGRYDLTVTSLRTESTFQTQNPTYTADFALTVTQPLLKGRGFQIRQAQHQIAKTAVAQSQYLFTTRVTEILYKVISLYWEGVMKREHLKVQQSSLGWAKELLELNKTKVALGVLAPIEILVAEVSVASRQEKVGIAQKDVEDIEEQLQNLIASETPILPADRPVEDMRVFDLPRLMEQAVNERSEIKAQTLQIQNQVLSVTLAEDASQPVIDFVGRIGPNGIGRHFADAFDQFSSGSLYRWEAGWVMTYPLGNRIAAAARTQARAEQHKAELEKEKLMDQVRLEVTEGHRRLTTDYERIGTTRRALDLAKKQHTAGEERFRLGLLSSHDLIQFQNDVAVAEGDALRAVIDYNKSLANLYKVTGALLSQYHIEVLP